MEGGRSPSVAVEPPEHQSSMGTDRMFSVGAMVTGTLAMIVSLVVPSPPVLYVLEVASLVAIVAVAFGARPRPGVPGSLARVRFSARVPTYAASAAFVVYAAVLTTVHTDTVNHQQGAYGRAVTRLGVANRSANRADSVAGRASALAVTELERGLRRINSPASRLAAFFKALARVKGLAAEIRRGHGFLVIRRFASALPLPRAEQSKLTRSYDAAITDQRKAAKADAAYIRALPGKAPPLDALPAWFSQLARFFQLSAQLLAAMTIALLFTRRARFEDAAERHLGVAIQFAFFGILAGLVGSLPDIHRGLQAFLLGYVAAAFAGALAALWSTSSVQRNL